MERFDLAVALVRQAGAALRQARLVSVRREGKKLFYRLADCHPQAIIRLAMCHIHEENN